MGDNIQLLQYADTDKLVEYINNVIKKQESFFVNYQVDLKKMDDIFLHKLLFDYKILAFFEEGNDEFAVIKLPELEEKENAVTLWILKHGNMQLLPNVIEKIKEEYSFYGWQNLKIVALRQQVTEELKELLESCNASQPIVYRGNKVENDKFIYFINLL